MRKKSILVAQSNEEFSADMVAAFTEEKFEVTAAKDGKSALEQIRSVKYDTIVIDITMPEISGMQIIAYTKSQTQNRSTPVIIACGQLDSQGIDQAKKLGVTDIFVRKSDLSQLLKRVKLRTKDLIKPSGYDPRLVLSFVNAAKEVLEFYLEESPEVGEPEVKTDLKTHGFVTGVIGFIGQGIIGSNSISCNEDLINILAAKVFMDDNVEVDDLMAADLIGEMANQVIGKVKINFNKVGVKMNIGLPEVIVGRDHMVVHKSENPVISIPIKYHDSYCYIEFSMIERAEMQIDEDAGEDAPDSIMIFS